MFHMHMATVYYNSILSINVTKFPVLTGWTSNSEFRATNTNVQLPSSLTIFCILRKEHRPLIALAITKQ